eukprot:gnl/TRDRNA2_/TRDRNA2_151028_c0_seq1.p1 gnl/TRDRNA2_/TRDRNA2_151028_c0~~gnl/TRDRNA2_/TRDRNA2_151028_c0_seq1.p1  ORF type:complete len:385 (+),score=28.86 gnl/TRDRNA2_/TRDRNA2_151028_c0_seq1:58-1212(+)
MNFTWWCNFLCLSFCLALPFNSDDGDCIHRMPKRAVQAWLGKSIPTGRERVRQATMRTVQASPGWEYVFLGPENITNSSFPLLFPQLLLAKEVYIRKHGKTPGTFPEGHPLDGLPSQGLATIADMLRYEYIYSRGGFWIDINMQLFKGLDPIILESCTRASPSGDALFGVHEENKYEPGGDHELKELNWTVPASPTEQGELSQLQHKHQDLGGPLSLGIFGATPKHPSLQRIVEEIRHSGPERHEMTANYATGPFPFGRAVNTSEGVYLMPSYMFYPVPWSAYKQTHEGLACEADACASKYPNLWGAEHWELGGSWKEGPHHRDPMPHDPPVKKSFNATKMVHRKHRELDDSRKDAPNDPPVKKIVDARNRTHRSFAEPYITQI